MIRPQFSPQNDPQICHGENTAIFSGPLLVLPQVQMVYRFFTRRGSLVLWDAQNQKNVLAFLCQFAIVA